VYLPAGALAAASGMDLDLTGRGRFCRVAAMPPRALLFGPVALALACTVTSRDEVAAAGSGSSTVPAVAPVAAQAPAWREVGAVPGEPAAVREWLPTFAYRGWAPQTDIRATGEHGGERLYFNATLAASMQAGAAEHPLGSAAVRELYAGDLTTLKGFALMHKTGPSGPTGEGWYWYEVLDTTGAVEPTVAGPGARDCVGCHAHAVDFVHSPDTRREDPQPLL
jgi:hypothetical protein